MYRIKLSFLFLLQRPFFGGEGARALAVIYQQGYILLIIIIIIILERETKPRVRDSRGNETTYAKGNLVTGALFPADDQFTGISTPAEEHARAPLKFPACM